MTKAHGIHARVTELLEQLQIEKDQQKLVVIISELGNMGAAAKDAIPYLHTIADQWKGFQLTEIVKWAVHEIEKSVEKEARPKRLTSIRDEVRESAIRIMGKLGTIVKTIVGIPFKVWRELNIWFPPQRLIKLLIFLSIVVPLSAFIIRLVGNLFFWAFWALVFYSTIWAFGNYNRAYCGTNTTTTGGIVRRVRFINRKHFLSWFLLETIFFFSLGWFELIRNFTVLLILFFAIFGIFGLVYGLADITCPHCGAINGGIKLNEDEDRINYLCCVCNLNFSHSKGMD